ncbi:MAG: hypothetical protein JO011_06270 [Ktedonobacteraceae bacterium]|nr:hypothetical protein [Ktedonobacteraceae bacterium]
MVSLKRFSLLLFGLLLTVFIAACSNPMSSNTTTTGSTNNGSNTMANNSNGNGSYGNSSGMATPTMAPKNNNNMGNNNNNNMGNNNNNMGNNNGNMGMQGDSNAFIHTTKVMLNGKMITVLTNAKGMILYYKLNDPKNQTNCTMACAMDWPPVLATDMNMMTVSSSVPLPHKLTVLKTANGNQIAYDGHFLYTYAGDMAPGQHQGRGIGGVWYLVSLAL